MWKNRFWPAAIPLIAVWSIAVATSADSFFLLVDAQSAQPPLSGHAGIGSVAGEALEVPMVVADAGADERAADAPSGSEEQPLID